MSSITDSSSIKALISLLEDPNELIYSQVNANIIALGDEAIPHLHDALEESKNDLEKERIVKVLDKLKLSSLEEGLNIWANNHKDDLLLGLMTIAKYGNPKLDEEKINNLIDEIVNEIKPKITYDAPEELIHLLNQTILYDYGFNGNIRNYSSVNNSYIDRVFHDKVSNPIGLSAIYLIVAEILDIPLIGINSPGHFVLGYVDKDFSQEQLENGSVIENVEFYIDPFNNGKIIQTNNFDHWLKEIPFDLEEKHYLPATNVDIIRRVMNNLIHSIFTSGKKETAKKLLQINDNIY
ncbi:transglutaminase family protein [Tenacibaculum xiamenense]|uniref:transglutaminase family protein n=1 Tax=Tenacibaculum xiamenense TaxID=1261553 RepID=UPI00389546CE